LNPSACRRSLSAPRILAATLCLGVLGSAPGLKAQATTQPAPATAAQPFDATNLREPLYFGGQGLVQDGDDPAFARPDFDDSHWHPIDVKTRPAGPFPHNQPGVIWQRLHVRIAPGQTALALQAFCHASAYEVYVNGQELMHSGQVKPFVPYTHSAGLIAPIPDAQLRTGSLVIAIREQFSRDQWNHPVRSFYRDELALGQLSVLRDQDSLYVIRQSAERSLESLLCLGVGLAALFLYIAQRRQSEYLWIFVMGITFVALRSYEILTSVRNIHLGFQAFYYISVDFVGNAAQVFLCQAFLRRRFSWQLWLFAAVSMLVAYIATVMNTLGSFPPIYLEVVRIPYELLTDVILPWLFFLELRRGNREAGILLFPLLFWSLSDYVSFAAAVQQQIPALRSYGSEWVNFVYFFHVGKFAVNLKHLGFLSWWCSLGIIMVRRFTRASLQQAVLEGELEAAREVQQVLLPEQVESVPGFVVESVYQPAQQVGGDFFQILPDGDGGLLVVVGDVAGKGLPAAMLVSVLVGAIRGVAEYTKNPEELLANLNERLVGRGGGGFSTALVARISATGSVTVANAGHLSPYLDGKEVELPGALPLGVMTGVAYETTQLFLAPGSRLTFYSDGVVEAQNQNGELFGFDRAREISTQPAAAIVEAARQFGQEDDITVVTIFRQDAIASAA
jgi:phosphoserine phosphatase RsbU/P